MTRLSILSFVLTLIGIVLLLKFMKEFLLRPQTSSAVRSVPSMLGDRYNIFIPINAK